MRQQEFRFYYFTPLYEQTVAFYRDVLGFDVYHSWDRGAADRGTIFRSPNGAGFIEVEAGETPPAIRGGFYIEVADVGGWHEDVRRQGGRSSGSWLRPVTGTGTSRRQTRAGSR